jgi:hypothetical protein
MQVMRPRRLAAWLALLAIALQAVWPLLAQARPKSVVLVPVCTVQGVTHYIELPKSRAPVEQKAASQHDHCSFCSSGGERAALTPAFQVFKVVDVLSSLVLPRQEASVESHAVLAARPRAPPVLQDVHVNNEHFWRTHEEQAVVGPRGACAGDAVAGQRVVRLGVLHT